MIDHELPGLVGSRPLGFLAAMGLLRLGSNIDTQTRLHWRGESGWLAVISLPEGVDPVEMVMEDHARWADHPALAFAAGAERKIADLKHPPAGFRELMRQAQLADHPEFADFVSAYATGVTVDGSGQTKPTALHFCAGQQVFLGQIARIHDELVVDDVWEALYGPWVGREGTASVRWREGADRSRALLAFDPSKTKGTSVLGAEWLAFLSLPSFPVVPLGLRAMATTGCEGRGKRYHFTWPLWTEACSFEEAKSLIGVADLAKTDASWRAARGVGLVFRSEIIRSAQGYGNFAPANPL